MNVLDVNQELIWRSVPQQAVDLAEKCAGTAQKARKAIRNLPRDGFIELRYSKESDWITLIVGEWTKAAVCRSWVAALEPLATRVRVKYSHQCGHHGGDWIKLAMRDLAARACLEKQAASPTLSALHTGLGYKGFPLARHDDLFGTVSTGMRPQPLVSGLAGGILGAGIGYGAGWLGEKMLPEKWKRGKLRRSLAVMGGLMGAAPAAAWAASNVNNRKHWNAGEFNVPNINYDNTIPHEFGKISAMTSGYEPSIDSAKFQAMVFSEGSLSPQIQAAATGLVAGASAIGGTRFVTPLDMARMTAGMGTGYVSGALVGRALGAIMGMPEETQQKIRRTGMFAGIVANMIPLAFGL